MADYRKGGTLNLFYHNGTAWKTLAHAQDNSLSMSSETTEISSKDFGENPGVEVNKKNWSMSGSYLFTVNDAKVIIGMQQSGKKYSMAFAQVNEYEDWADGLESVTGLDTQDAWSISSAFVKYGDGIVTSAEITASNGDMATVSIEITGSEALLDTAPSTILSYPRT